MTQEKNSGPRKAPGFGAFIGSPETGNSSSEVSEPKSGTTTKDGTGTRRKRGGRGRGRSSGTEGTSAERSEKGAQQEEAPRKRGRSRRTTSSSDSSTEAEAPASADEGQPEDTRSRGRRGSGSRRRTRRKPDAEGQAEEVADQGEIQETTSGSGDEAKKPSRRKRGGRGRGSSSRASATEESAAETVSAEGEQSSESPQDSGSGGRRKRTVSRKKGRGSKKRTTKAKDEDQPKPGSSGGEDTEEGEKPKRRRRGTRGGRNRKRQSAASSDEPAAAVMELIPGEDDDLPELPDLPDDAELISPGGENSGSGKRTRKKRGRRSRGDSEGEEERKTSKKATRKTARTPEVVPDRKILVNAFDNEEMRVAVVRDGKILDFQMTVNSDTSLVNDIYRGRIVNIEASIGAAFVDFGRGRNGFLHTSDVLPTYAESGLQLSQLLSTSVDPEDWDASSSQPSVAAELTSGEESEEEGEAEEDGEETAAKSGKKKSSRKKRSSGRVAKGSDRGKSRQPRFRARPRRPISELFKVGQKVVVQITKDAIGDKGPTLTTYLSIPGRYLVLMPSISHRGVSRKIEDGKERKRLKRILDGLKVPDGMGIIARTATMGRTKLEITRDLDYLLSAWKRLAKRLDQGHGPMALYQESDVAIRTVRDLFGPETEAVIVDDHESYKSIREFAEQLMPEHVDRIVEHEGARPLFHSEGVEQDFEKIFARRIELPSGGSVVFDQAEALVAIDINSGKTRTSSHDFEEIALKTNMEAVPEIARQIRLRDLGGIIVVDFIDMMKNSNRKTVEQAFRSRFADDRARSKVGRISQFGLLEMTRQRLGPGINKKLFRPCSSCRGLGRTRTDSSRAAAILRRLGSALTLKGFSKVEVRAHPETISYLKKSRRTELNSLEESSGRTLDLKPIPDQIEDSVLRYLRADGREVRPGGRRKR